MHRPSTQVASVRPPLVHPLVLTLLMLLLWAVLPSAAAPALGLSFTVPKRYPTGAFPWAVAAGDLNPVALDLVTANRDRNTVTVYLGENTGRFGSKQGYAVGAEPTDVALADVNDDGALDILTADHAGSSVTVLLGDNAARFAPKVDFATPAYPRALAVADLNGDGHLDLAVVHDDVSTAGLSVLYGDGAGGFGTPVIITPPDYYRDVVAGDFNLDKVPDLAVALTQDEWAAVGILLGQGANGLAPMRNYGTYLEPWALAVGMMNEDYRPDLVVLEDYEGDGNAQTFLGDGLGSLVAVDQGFKTRPELAGLALADFDRDGHRDIATSRGNNVVILLGTATGSPSRRLSFSASGPSQAILAQDFNRDGLTDLAVVDPVHDTLGILLNGPRLRAVIDTITPGQAHARDIITITGHHFGSPRASGKVTFRSISASRYPLWTPTTIKVKVPGDTPRGRVEIRVKTVAGYSLPRYFYRE